MSRLARFVLCAALVLVASPAFAQQILGDWVNSGVLPNGGQYQSYVRFTPNGDFFQRTLLAGGPSNPAGSGVVDCSAHYSFDGHTLQTTQLQCGNMPPVAGPSGPVLFPAENVMTISGDTFHRTQ